MHDLRHALRLIGRNRIFSVAIIAILAVCIGANTAVLSVVNAAMFRPLDFPSPDLLVQVVTMFHGEAETSVDGASWELVRDRVPSLDAAVYSEPMGVNMGVNGAGVYVQQQRVSAGYFRVLGVPLGVGREFIAAEDRVGGPAAVILGNSLWKKYFHADRAIIGQKILLRGEPYTVVGVARADFHTDQSADLWTPLRPSRTGEGAGSNYGMIARLRPGVSWRQTSAQLALLTPDLNRVTSYGSGANVRLDVMSLQKAITSDLRLPLMILWGAVGVIFLLGCVNVGAMLLARASARSGEIATRLALGAPVRRIVQQLFVETTALALLGGVAGVGVGIAALKALRTLGSDAFPFLQQVSLDWRVLIATLALSLGGALVIGLLPAWQAARVDLRAVQLGSRTIAGRKRFVPLGALAGGQVALAVPLLIGAGLLFRTFLFLWNMNPGFDPNHVMTAQFSLQDARYATSQQMNELYDKVLDRLQATPGIESAAVALTLPYERALNEGVQLPGEDQTRITNLTYVTPQYFSALRIPLLQGRAFTEADGPASARVAIVNQAFASHYLKGHGAIGQILKLGKDSVTIAGVSGNVLQRRAGWGNFGPVAAVPTIYIPAAQTDDRSVQMMHTWFSPSWIVRGSLGGPQAMAAIENAVRAADPMLPVAGFRSIVDLKLESLTLQRFLAALLNSLAALAIVLTALGIYGLAANLVAGRTKELGIHLALGSTVPGAIGVVLRPALAWVLAGTAAGTTISLALEPFLKSFLWGVQTTDPISRIAVGAILLFAAALAVLVPAARIAHLNPADTLRD